MCGRFALKNPSKELKQYYNTSNDIEYKASYNIAPSQHVVTITEADAKRTMNIMRWGLVPAWAQDITIGNKMINARAETLQEKPSYRNAFKQRRCIIPASGFFEWHSKTREPYYISPNDSLFSIAGLWERWQDASGNELLTTTIITTEANKGINPIHHRMPVILDKNEVDLWLNEKTDMVLINSLLKPVASDKMQMWTVNKAVNNPANDKPENIEPLCPTLL